MKVVTIETKKHQGSAAHAENVQRWLDLVKSAQVLFVNTYTTQGEVNTMIFYEDEPQQTFNGEESTFSRYLNGTTSEGTDGRKADKIYNPYVKPMGQL